MQEFMLFLFFHSCGQCLDFLPTPSFLLPTMCRRQDQILPREERWVRSVVKKEGNNMHHKDKLFYQTGALTPFIRWVSRGMHRAAAPLQPQPVVRAENGPAIRPEDNNAPQPERNPGVQNENQARDNANQSRENENPPEPGRDGGVNWWQIAKEIQMIIVAFVTSLLPGFQDHVD
ncbi:uncharacterized protein LOC143878403 isoform X2 [Tasmannia lanceolata]|uniref:uncharacterized protein LOC143878403 isoform X2 n=1 Tax=Tasmannia lanceolata TaxID=3420 RepID=UPI0040635804